MKINRKSITLIAIIILLAILYIFFRYSLVGQLYRLGIAMVTDDMQLVDHYQEISGTNKIDWMVGQSRDKKLLLGHVTTQDPKKYIDDKIYLLTALYEPTPSPYPEAITNVIECPSEYKPVRQKNDFGIVFKLFAGERYGYGICTKDLVTYDSYYGLFDCGKKGIFEIKIFGQGNPGGLEKIIQSFRCTAYF